MLTTIYTAQVFPSYTRALASKKTPNQVLTAKHYMLMGYKQRERTFF